MLTNLSKKVKRARMIKEAIESEKSVEERSKMLKQYGDLCQRIGTEFLATKEFGVLVLESKNKFYGSDQQKFE